MVQGLSSYTATSTYILRLVLTLLQVLMLLKNKGEQGSVPVMRAIPWIERVISAEGKDAIAVLDKMPGHTAEGGRWFKVRRTCFYIMDGLVPLSSSFLCILSVLTLCPTLPWMPSAEPQPVAVRAQGRGRQVHRGHAQPQGHHGLHVPPRQVQGQTQHHYY